jgi:hypothetical protein
MEIPMMRTYDMETSETIDREMTAEELEVYKNEQKTFESEIAAKAKADAAKAALLTKLGITADEAALLLS